MPKISDPTLLRELNGGTARGVTVVPLNPYASNDERRKNEDQNFERERIRIAQEAEARANAALAAQIDNQNKPPAGFSRNPDGTLAFIPGGPADPALKSAAGVTPEIRKAAFDSFDDARAIDGIVRDLRSAYATGVGQTKGIAGLGDLLPTDSNKVFNDIGQRARGYVKRSLGFTGGEGNTLQESSALYDPFLPRAGDRDAQIVRKIAALEELGSQARSKATGILGGVPDAQGRVVPIAAASGQAGSAGPPGDGGPGSVWDQTYNTPGGPPGAAPSGSTEQGQAINPAMQAELDAFIQQQGRNITAPALRAYTEALYAQYGGQPGPTLDQWASDTAAALQRGGQINTNIPPQTVPLAGIDKFRNDVVGNPLGAGAASYFNAGGFGIPGLFASDQLRTLRDENPISSTVGELAGGVTGTLLGGAGLRAAGAAISNPAARGILGNPLTADVAYGSTYGATQAEDPLYGAVGGGLAAAAGGAIGNRIGGWLGGRRVADPLNAGERAVYDAVGSPSSVEAALMQGQDLGLPMTLADADPVVAALTGSAIRRSPTVAGQAREVLAQRSQGQLDRLRSGIERDLGPLDNVPQRADDLIAQARAAADPLYRDAYATSVPTSPELEGLLATPFGRQALARSRTIAANEQRSPTELGFSLDAEGNTVLNPVPNDLVARHLMARDALREAQESFRNSRSTAGYDRDAGLSQIEAARQGLRDAEAALNAAPTPGAQASVPTYTTQSLDYAKRGMDDILESNRNPITGRLELDEMGRSQNQVLRSLLGEMDARNPAYGQARAAYAGPAAERQALLQGRDALTMNPDDVATLAGRQTPERLDLMQLGARDRINQGAEALSNSTNPYRVLNTPAMERRLSALYPGREDDVARLLTQRDLENRMASTANSLVGNSATAERQLADQAFADESLLRPVLEGGVETLVTGAPVTTVLRSGVGNRIADALRLGAGRRAVEKAEQIAPLALNPDPAATIAELLALQQRSETYQALVEQARNRVGRRGDATGSGSSAVITAALLRD